VEFPVSQHSCKEVYVNLHVAWGDYVLWGCTCGILADPSGYELLKDAWMNAKRKWVPMGEVCGT